VPQLIASLSNLGVLGEDAVHRSFRAEVAILVEETGVDLGGSLVGEARLVQDIEHDTPFLDGERPSRGRPGRRRLGL